MGNIHLVTGHAGEAHVTAADHGSLNAAVFGSGQYVLDRGNKLAASIISNNSIRIADGDILMQGRHIRLNEGDYIDLAIQNGEQGMLRHDLIVCRYTMNSQTGVEETNLVVIKGTSAASNPQDPAYTSGDIITGHAFQADFPLYRVPLNGLNIQELVPLFDIGYVNYEMPNGFVKTDKLADGAVTKAKIADGAVSTEKIAEKAITDEKLATEYLPMAGGTMKGALKAFLTEPGASTVRNIYAGTEDMTAGTTALETGVLYLVYEYE